MRRLGYEVAGAERSIEALLQTDRALEEEGFDASLGLGLGNNILEVIDLPAFDGVISHRTLHLLDEQELSKFVTACVRMKEKSILAVSARDIRDYDPGQMRLLDEGTAEYTLPDRRGHRISFWTADRFRSTLGPYFDLIELIQGEETEAAGNVLKNAHFTIMIGRRNHCCPDASG